ncbi:G0/G1 switch protein 2-like [Sardina pilchardus]|uniref:G0/G1 switch protein 2-like n=1 Tax=Sardina pilchardus TaxID=27697 RepID=UPI002E0F34CE
METLQEVIPFAKEMINQKPSRGMLKVYLVGSVVAVLGTVLGLVQTVCQPFSSFDDAALDAELAKLVARELREEERRRKQGEVAERANYDKPQRENTAGVAHRSAATRLHAS